MSQHFCPWLWASQFRCSSIKTPRYLIWDYCSIWQVVKLILVFCFGEAIIMKLVFLKLIDSILAAQYFKTFAKFLINNSFPIHQSLTWCETHTRTNDWEKSLPHATPFLLKSHLQVTLPDSIKLSAINLHKTQHSHQDVYSSIAITCILNGDFGWKTISQCNYLNWASWETNQNPCYQPNTLPGQLNKYHVHNHYLITGVREDRMLTQKIWV